MLASSMRVVLLVLAAAAPASVAKPVHLASRDAVAPPITNPTAQTVWRVGETQTVTWDVAALNGAPPSNPQASIILGTLSADGNEHLQFETPLVSGFPILGGNVTLTVPPVPSGSNYIVCLFGTSDDISPAFAIVGTDASSSSAAPPSPAPSSTAASTITTATTPSPPSSVLASTSTAGPTSQAGAPRASSQTSAAAAAAAPPTTAEASAPLGSAPSSVPGTAGGASPNAAAAHASSSSSSSSGAAPSTTSAGTSGGPRNALTRAHRWGVGCALAFALVFV